MITREGPKVIEFNCRFGDPECQAIMPRLDDDLLPLLARGGAPGRGCRRALAWSPETSVCVVMSSGGYPGPYETGRPIAGVEAAEALPGVNVFHAGTALREGALRHRGRPRARRAGPRGGRARPRSTRPTPRWSASGSRAPTTAATSRGGRSAGDA